MPNGSLNSFLFSESEDAEKVLDWMEDPRGNIIGLVDARIAIEADIEEVRRVAMVAGLCIQDDENERPSMNEVVKILEGTMGAPVLQIPRSLQVLLDQIVDEDNGSFGQHPSILSDSISEPVSREKFKNIKLENIKYL
ncbi:hypothetical protein SUGI_1090170 [Cryptomeria japonica]|nr:hypothetical protein SUGI_1090170 [Cryptomeria japonica]